MDKTTKSTQSTAFDPAMQSLITGNVTRAQNLADSIQPYTGQVNAAQSPLIGSYFDQAQGIQGTGAPLLGSATGAATKALGYTPMQVTPPTATAASAGQAATYDPSSALGLLGSAATGQGFDRSQIGNIALGTLSEASLAPFLDPATNDLVNASLADNEHARQVAANNDAAKAAAAGAFGNSGFGVAKSLTNDAYQRSADTASANLRSQAFQDALNGWLGARGQDLSAAQSNQGADLAAAQSQAAASQFNAGQKNALSQTGAGLLSSAGQFNAGQTNAQNQTNAGFAQQAGLANQSAALQAALANQNAGLQGNQQTLTGAGLLGDLSNSQVNQTLGLTGLLGTAGGVQQALSQNDLDRLSQLYQQNINNQLQGQQVVNGATGLIPSITNRTDNTTQTQNGGLGSILGGLGTLALGLGTGGVGLLGSGGLLGGLLGGGAMSGLGNAALGTFGAGLLDQSGMPSMYGFDTGLPNLGGFVGA